MVKLTDVITDGQILRIGVILRDIKEKGGNWRSAISNMHDGRIDNYKLEDIITPIRMVRNQITSDPEIFAGLVK